MEKTQKKIARRRPISICRIARFGSRSRRPSFTWLDSNVIGGASEFVRRSLFDGAIEFLLLQSDQILFKQNEDRHRTYAVLYETQ